MEECERLFEIILKAKQGDKEAYRGNNKAL
ncbi:hypothetical protein TKV_c04020 [Thermoanaerobacter kivui]|uniref:Uncharacterized protein n=1 Tax=Thermoanaerobacter kivui TaxID=2325 RepID=A0A097AP74_THEKI|nr:hypothetical protein TKV_c04020 [Thermoanaerobacter kivui]